MKTAWITVIQTAGKACPDASSATGTGPKLWTRRKLYSCLLHLAQIKERCLSCSSCTRKNFIFQVWKLITGTILVPLSPNEVMETTGAWDFHLGNGLVPATWFEAKDLWVIPPAIIYPSPISGGTDSQNNCCFVSLAAVGKQLLPSGLQPTVDFLSCVKKNQALHSVELRNLKRKRKQVYFANKLLIKR